MKSVSFAVLFLFVVIGSAFGQKDDGGYDPATDSTSPLPIPNIHSDAGGDSDYGSDYFEAPQPQHIKIFSLNVVGNNADDDATKKVNAWLDSMKDKIVILGDPKVVATDPNRNSIVIIYTYIDIPVKKSTVKPTEPAPVKSSAYKY